MKRKRSGYPAAAVGLAVVALALVPVAAGAAAQAPQKLKVFISVDMEGVAGVIHWEDVSRDGLTCRRVQSIIRFR